MSRPTPANEGRNAFPFERQNYFFFLLGLGLLAVGYLLMSGGGVEGRVQGYGGGRQQAQDCRIFFSYFQQFSQNYLHWGGLAADANAGPAGDILKRGVTNLNARKNVASPKI